MLVDTNLVTPFSELYGCWRVADNVFRRARSLISSMEMQEILRFGWVGWGETGRGGEVKNISHGLHPCIVLEEASPRPPSSSPPHQQHGS
jgi:hypothetical protein